MPRETTSCWATAHVCAVGMPDPQILNSPLSRQPPSYDTFTHQLRRRLRRLVAALVFLSPTSDVFASHYLFSLPERVLTLPLFTSSEASHNSAVVISQFARGIANIKRALLVDIHPFLTPTSCYGFYLPALPRRSSQTLCTQPWLCAHFAFSVSSST